MIILKLIFCPDASCALFHLQKVQEVKEHNDSKETHKKHNMIRFSYDELFCDVETTKKSF